MKLLNHEKGTMIKLVSPDSAALMHRVFFELRLDSSVLVKHIQSQIAHIPTKPHHSPPKVVVDALSIDVVCLSSGYSNTITTGAYEAKVLYLRILHDSVVEEEQVNIDRIGVITRCGVLVFLNFIVPQSIVRPFLSVQATVVAEAV
jgi:hypothetical protein